MTRKKAFYFRNSTEEQAEKGTIEGQLDYAKKFIELYGITDYEFYIDEGTSGTIPLDKRNDGKRLLEDIKRDRLNELYVYRLDRLARNTKIVLDTYDLIEKHKMALKSMTESFDTSTPTGKFFMTMLASIAALEKDTIKERTQLGKERKIKQGKIVNGHTPFGWRKNSEGYLEVFEDEAKHIRKIFELYKDGMNLLELATYLNATGVPVCSTGRSKRSAHSSWQKSRLSDMLRNEMYIGKYSANRTSQKGKEITIIEIPPIVSEEVFQAVQKVREVNLERARGSRGKIYLLSGLILCGKCNRIMVGSKNTVTRSYYRCPGMEDDGRGVRCSGTRVRAEAIEKAIWEDVLECLKNPQAYADELRKQLSQEAETAKPIEEEMAIIETAITQKQEGRKRILSLITKGHISDEDAESELSILAGDIKSLISRREYLFSRKEEARNLEREILSVQIILDNWSKTIDFDSITEEEKPDIIKNFVSKIVMKDAGKLDIYLRGTRSYHSKENEPETTLLELKKMMQL